MTEVGPNRQQCLGRSSRTTRRANHFVAINLQLWHVYPLSQNILLPDSRKSFLQALPSWPTEGRCATSSTRDGMRWTLAALKTSAHAGGRRSRVVYILVLGEIRRD